MTRIAAYCRVSTDKADQIHSFNSQKLFFSQYIDSKTDWVLAEIYTDEGITGTSASARLGFLRMIDDASNGKFDVIITKEVSRFSRNILDAISYTRQLKAAGVGVIFLNDGISTLDPDAELRLGIMASVAQEESRRTSERVRWGQLRRMEKGVVFGRSLLGYDVSNGKIAVESGGAATVRRIFSMYLDERMGVRAIAAALTEEGVLTKTGGGTWSGAAVLKIIRNEKYCGDLLQKKTVTVDYLTHKKRRNPGNDHIYIRAHHEPIISREDWEKAQAERKRRAHFSAGTVPCGIRYALSGRVFCAGCGAVYYCRTRKRRDGSAYRVWSSGRCSCLSKTGGIREEALVLIVRHILKCCGEKPLVEGLSTVIHRIFKEHEPGLGECEKKLEKTKGKLVKLADLYVAGEIGREEYAVLKTRYETELDELARYERNLPAAGRGEAASKAVMTAEALAAGEVSDTDFYLSIIDRIHILNNAQIDVVFSNSAGKWSVEVK